MNDHECVVCGESSTVSLPFDKGTVMFAFPDWSDKRHVLRGGIHTECWEVLFDE